MHKGRLEAFSDGVLAIILTVMVLELRPPQGASWAALTGSAPALSLYALSFVYIGIYWNNHHHMLQSARNVNGSVLWANLHLLFWLSLTPFATNWLGVTGLQPIPLAVYGCLFLMAGIAFTLLSLSLVKAHGRDSAFARALGNDLKGKISLLIYAVGIALAWLAPVVTCSMYILVAVIWFVPDKRFEHPSQASSGD